MEVKRLTDLRMYKYLIHKVEQAKVTEIAESIKRIGLLLPVVINRQGIVLDGHLRVKALMELGVEEVPCFIAPDRSVEDEIIAMLAMNRYTSNWDEEVLKEVYKEIGDKMADGGFLQQELDILSDRGQYNVEVEI